MARIQTINGTIVVKENYDEVFKRMEFTWFEAMEDASFYGELTGKYYDGCRRVRINSNHVVSIHDDEISKTIEP